MVFLCNLCLTLVAILFELSNNERSPAPICISTVTAFLIFVGIVLYHAQRQVFLTKAGAKLKNKIVQIHQREALTSEPKTWHDSEIS